MACRGCEGPNYYVCLGFHSAAQTSAHDDGLLKTTPSEGQDCMHAQQGQNQAFAFSTCRKECQRADWPAHKPVCKKHQAAKARLQVSVVLEEGVLPAKYQLPK
jgi:hypothetical protein